MVTHDDKPIRILCGKLNDPASPLYKFGDLEEDVRRQVLEFIQRGLVYPLRAGLDFYLNPPDNTVILMRCGDIPPSNAPDGKKQPFNYIVEVQLPRIRLFRTARAVDFYPDSELRNRLAKRGIIRGI